MMRKAHNVEGCFGTGSRAMLCRFCHINPSSVDAHIIPRSFFVEHADDRYPSKQITDLENVFPKKLPIGVYDSNILCDTCEALFSADDYGYKFFHPPIEYPLITDGHGNHAYLIKDVDYDKLKLFLLSVLWRASVSTQDFYAGVNLGPDEEKIRRLLQQRDPGSPDEYSVYLERFDYPSSLVPILGPFKVLFDDIEMYQLVLNGFLVYIKVGEKPLPQELRAIMLSSEQPLLVPQVPYEGSQEREIALKVLSANKRA